MKLANTALLATALAFTAGLTVAGEASFSTKPIARKAGAKTTISFAVSRKTDVEVAILDAGGKVVCHLAAGVLGGKTPPPLPLKPGLSQILVWDGKNDYGKTPPSALHPRPFTVRVRAGMGVKMEKIVGGDPYAFYSKQSGNGDHAQWEVSGLEAKSDGSVYVMGNTVFHGAQVIRQYDAEGNYVRTVFPPAAGKPVADVIGWGVNIRDDGSWTLRHNERSWKSTAVSTTLLSGRVAVVGSLVPTPEKGTLTLRGQGGGQQAKFMRIGTDGSLKTYDPKPFFGSTPLATGRGLRGPCFTALAPDGKHLYVSGPHSYKRKPRSSRALSVDTTGFWRDGQVWKLNRATRKMSAFFALDEKQVISDMKTRSRGPIGDKNYIAPFAALHGVAVDAEGRVFLCDRQNKRIVVLDKNGKLIREIPNVAYPDAIGISPKSKALYVTTRFARGYGGGKLALLKFNDWSKDSAPAVTVPLAGNIGRYSHKSMLTVVEHKGQVLVWVAYTTLPVRVYRDTGTGLALVKDFYAAGPQRALDLQHMQVDQKTGDVYIADAQGWCFRISDWKNPKFQLCIDAATKKQLKASSIAIDHRNRYLYAHFQYRGRVRRYKLDGEHFTPAPVGQSGNEVTLRICCAWGFVGMYDRGLAAAPGGGLATLGFAYGGRSNNYSGPLRFWKPEEAKVPWPSVLFTSLGRRPCTGGIRFDPRGNLYVGVKDGTVNNIPRGFAKDKNFRGTTARIYKYVPTGSLKDGDLFPTAPSAPAKIYDVHYNALYGSRTPRFGVDGWGRIYYPSAMQSRVSVIDNQGNRILSLGTWGNRDSTGGLEGDLVPTRDVPMAWPRSVDATDDYIYVTDIINIRLLRLKKTFAATETCKVR
jgi:hypothetical protein